MVTVTSIIESIDWEMSKSDLSNAFAYMEQLPPHPTENAIGFATVIHGISSAVICYFQRKMFKEHLGAINIMIYDSPPGLLELQKAFRNVAEELTAAYGQPRYQMDQQTVWVSRGRVLQLNSKTGVIGIRLGDPKVDLPSKIAIGTEGE